MKIRNKVLSVFAVTGLAAGAVVLPTVAAPADSGVVSAAQAVPYKPGFPARPARKQPIGWGDQCYTEIQQHRNGTSTFKIYRWLTFSLGGSQCVLYQQYTR